MPGPTQRSRRIYRSHCGQLRESSKYCAQCVLLLSLLMPIAASAADKVQKLPSGTLIGPRPPAGWSNVVFVSTPKVAHGDLGKVSSTVVQYAELLHFVVLADVQRQRVGDNVRHHLVEVGFGLAISKSGALIVASGPRAAGLEPPELGILENQVVRGAAASLDEMRIIGRRSTLMLLDSPAVFSLRGEHQALIMRTLIWVDPLSGKLGHLLWLLKENPNGQLELALPAGAYLPTPFHEQREMRVDADEFNYLGLPGPLGFALVRLPPGKAVAMEGPLATLASRKEYTTEQLRQLIAALNAALRT